MKKIVRLTEIAYLEKGDRATITTHGVKLMRKLNKLDETRPDECRFERLNKDGSVTYTVPKTWIRVSPPATHTMSEEQKAANAERLKAARLARKKDRNHESE